jgi:hypothetical protein
MSHGPFCIDVSLQIVSTVSVQSCCRQSGGKL